MRIRARASRFAAAGWLASVAWLAAAARAVGAVPEARLSSVPEVSLAWSGPVECPSGDDVVARAQRLLSKSDSPQTPLVARGNVVSEADGWRLELDTWPGDQPYRRTLRASSCAELADAAALILALLVDPGLRPEPSPGEIVDRVEKTSGANVQPAAPAARWGVRAGPVVDIGALPSVAAGLEAGAVARWGSFRLDVGATLFPWSGEEVVPATPAQLAKGGHFMLLAGKAQACYRALERFEVSGCAGGEVGFLRGSGYGIATNDPHTVLWAAAGPGVQAEAPLTGSLRLSGGADLLVALQRPQFVLENVGFVYRPAAISGRFALDLILLFP